MTVTCKYVTSLDRECGRPATQPGPHCDFHSVLAQLEAIDHRQDETVITVPASQRPMVDRILSDVLANFDAMPYRSMDELMSKDRNPGARVMPDNTRHWRVQS
jgi:hypothetical protein